MDRFFSPAFATGSTVELDESESHHLAHVLRHDAGDEVELFDGRGTAATARVERVRKRSVTVAITGDLRVDSPPTIELTLGVAAPKGDRLRWLVEKATELGVTSFVPIQCERSVVEPKEARLMKLEQTVLAACKQSGRNTAMSIAVPQTLADFLTNAAPAPRLLATLGGEPIAHWGHRNSASGTRKLFCAIGPEGGFTPHEESLATAAGAQEVSLGGAILRVETAAIAAAAILILGGPLQSD